MENVKKGFDKRAPELVCKTFEQMLADKEFECIMIEYLSTLYFVVTSSDYQGKSRRNQKINARMIRMKDVLHRYMRQAMLSEAIKIRRETHERSNNE
jgi:hypothetical protein